MLEVEKLNAHYGPTHVLWNVSFQMKEHESISIIGPNGAGKTTLLNCIMGLMRYSCKIRLDGEDISILSTHHSRNH